jgi:hypothetical protein
MPNRHEPHILAQGELPPEGRGGSKTLGQRGGDHRRRQCGRGEEDERGNCSEHIREPCLLNNRGPVVENVGKSASRPILFPVCPG